MDLAERLGNRHHFRDNREQLVVKCIINFRINKYWDWLLIYLEHNHRPNHLFDLQGKAIRAIYISREYKEVYDPEIEKKNN